MPKSMLTGPDNITVYTPAFYFGPTGFQLNMENQIENWNGDYQSAFQWYEFYIRNEIDLSGIAAEQLSIYVQGWDVQEAYLPWVTKLTGVVKGDSDQGGTQQQVIIHDIFTTEEIKGTDIFGELFSTTADLPPAMIDQLNAPGSITRYLNFEQVVCARSRQFQANRDTDNGAIVYPQNLCVKVNDQVWGSGEPIAADKLYHIRAVRFFNDTDASGDFISTFFQVIPPAIIPLAVEVADLPFLAQMTNVRRSLDV